MFFKCPIQKKMPGHGSHGSQHSFVADASLAQRVYHAFAQAFVPVLATTKAKEGEEATRRLMAAVATVGSASVTVAPGDSTTTLDVTGVAPGTSVVTVGAATVTVTVLDPALPTCAAATPSARGMLRAGQTVRGTGALEQVSVGLPAAATLARGQPLPVADDRPFYFRSSRRGYQTPRAQAGHEVDGFSDGQLKLIDEHFGDDLQRLSLYDLQGDPKELAPLHEGPSVQAAHQRLVELRAAQTR